MPRSVNCVDTTVRRGDIYYADLSPVVGSEQGGVRAVMEKVDAAIAVSFGLTGSHLV